MPPDLIDAPWRGDAEVIEGDDSYKPDGTIVRTQLKGSKAEWQTANREWDKHLEHYARFARQLEEIEDSIRAAQPKVEDNEALESMLANTRKARAVMAKVRQREGERFRRIKAARATVTVIPPSVDTAAQPTAGKSRVRESTGTASRRQHRRSSSGGSRAGPDSEDPEPGEAGPHNREGSREVEPAPKGRRKRKRTPSDVRRKVHRRAIVRQALWTESGRPNETYRLSRELARLYAELSPAEGDECWRPPSGQEWADRKVSG